MKHLYRILFSFQSIRALIGGKWWLRWVWEENQQRWISECDGGWLPDEVW